MSGIYIPDMKMPKENDYTIVIVYGDGVVTEYHDDYWIRGADGEKQIGTAVPVPPHGRLIDADAAAKKGWTISRTYSASLNEMVYEVKTMTDEVLPTIIPAEEET